MTKMRSFNASNSVATSVKSLSDNKSDPWWLFCSGFSFLARKEKGSSRALFIDLFRLLKSTALGESQLANPVFSSTGI